MKWQLKINEYTSARNIVETMPSGSDRRYDVASFVERVQKTKKSETL